MNTRRTFVPLVGISSYLFMIRKLLLIGTILASCVFGLLKFRYTGQSNYSIQQMSSSLSLLVQLENQKKMKQVSYRLAFASFMIGFIPVFFFLKIPEMP